MSWPGCLLHKPRSSGARLGSGSQHGFRWASPRRQASALLHHIVARTWFGSTLDRSGNPIRPAGPKKTAPGRAVGEEARHLRDGEDEDEVEEELQRRDALFALGLSIVHHKEFVERGTSLIVADRASGVRTLPTMLWA